MKIRKKILMLFPFLFIHASMAETSLGKDCVNCSVDLDFNKSIPNVKKVEPKREENSPVKPRIYSNNGYTYQISVSDTVARNHQKRVEFKDNLYLTEKRPTLPTLPKRVSRNKQISRSLIAIQLGAFRHYAGAKKYVKKYAILSSEYKVTIKSGAKNQKPLYRVQIEGFTSKSQAEEFKQKYGLAGAFLVMN